MKTGTIPKDLKIFQRDEIDIEFRWDDIEVEDFQKVTKCIPVFVTDATNAKTQKTAEAWARNARWHWDPVSGQRVDTGTDCIKFERPNDPISGIRLIGLERRSQGGRAYKALVLDKYVVDFREDVLLDAILNGGILDNGVLPGEYIFASVGSEMKLIRVGSLLHEKMIEATNYWKKDVITSLEIGGIYRNKTKTVLYLGPIYTSDLEVEWVQRSNPYASWGSSSYQYDDQNVPPRRVIVGKERKAFLFIEVNAEIKSLSDIDRSSPYMMTLYDKLPKSFREKVGHIEGEAQTLIDEWQSLTTPQLQGRQAKDLVYYSARLNVSTQPGHVHPLIQRILTK